MDPFVNLHNCALDDEPLAIEELGAFARQGGRTVVDPTCRGIGRDPEALRAISPQPACRSSWARATTCSRSHPAAVKAMSAEAIADEIVEEALDGGRRQRIRIGLIGEIGVSSDFTSEEEKSLRGAARAQSADRTAADGPSARLVSARPPGARHRRGGGRRRSADRALPHEPVRSRPGLSDEPRARGAFLEYDMIGMDYFYADQGVQCPSDDENAPRDQAPDRRRLRSTASSCRRTCS